MNGHGKIDVQEEEFQNVIEPTHIPEIEKCPSRGIIRRKEEGQDFGGIFRVILNVLNLILYVTVAFFFFFFFFEQKRYDFILSSGYFAKASETE